MISHNEPANNLVSHKLFKQNKLLVFSSFYSIYTILRKSTKRTDYTEEQIELSYIPPKPHSNSLDEYKNFVNYMLDSDDNCFSNINLEKTTHKIFCPQLSANDKKDLWIYFFNILQNKFDNLYSAKNLQAIDLYNFILEHLLDKINKTNEQSDNKTTWQEIKGLALNFINQNHERIYELNSSKAQPLNKRSQILGTKKIFNKLLLNFSSSIVNMFFVSKKSNFLLISEPLIKKDGIRPKLISNTYSNKFDQFCGMLKTIINSTGNNLTNKPNNSYYNSDNQIHALQFIIKRIFNDKDFTLAQRRELAERTFSMLKSRCTLYLSSNYTSYAKETYELICEFKQELDNYLLFIAEKFPESLKDPDTMQEELTLKDLNKNVETYINQVSRNFAAEDIQHFNPK